jgi:hypothetical protein
MRCWHLLHPPLRSGPDPPIHRTPLRDVIWLGKAGMYAGFEQVRLCLVSAEGPPDGEEIVTFRNLLRTS